MTHKEKCTGVKFEIMYMPNIGFQIAHFVNGVSGMSTFWKDFYSTAQRALEAIANKFPETKANQIVLPTGNKINWLKRMWINQPSTSQPFHKYHGTNVLVDTQNEIAYFLNGDTYSMDILMNALSDGWKKTKLDLEIAEHLKAIELLINPPPFTDDEKKQIQLVGDYIRQTKKS